MEISALLHNLILPLSAAFVCGLVLGLDRELLTSLRTADTGLITLGSTIFVVAGIKLFFS